MANKILKLASAKAMLSLGKVAKVLLVHICPISLSLDDITVMKWDKYSCHVVLVTRIHTI